MFFGGFMKDHSSVSKAFWFEWSSGIGSGKTVLIRFSMACDASLSLQFVKWKKEDGHRGGHTVESNEIVLLQIHVFSVQVQFLVIQS